MRVLFDSNKATKKFILGVFGKTLKDEKVVEGVTGEPVLSMNGEETTLSAFAGIRKGSEIILKNDIGFLVDYARKYRR